ncbi:unnamed protein product, partial [Didymodactylos carnosus]
DNVNDDDDDQDAILAPMSNSVYDYPVLTGSLSDVQLSSSTSSDPVLEYYVLDIANNISSSIADNKCMLVSRMSEGEKQLQKITVRKLEMLFSTQSSNCTEERHVLCETSPMVERGIYDCYQKPFVMDLPALVTSQMTHERCLTTCKELQTSLAIISMNMCYCQANDWAETQNITRDFQIYKEKSCGNPCSGNSHEKCGSDDIIVLFQIIGSRTYSTYQTPAEQYPDFIFDSCISLNQRLISSITMQFRLQQRVSPRHCLSLCVDAKQKYSLIQNRTCLCTDNNLKQELEDAETVTGQSCSIPCDGNYLYSCGGEKNIYSMYMMQPNCNHGYEIAENNAECVYSHFSTKTPSFDDALNYCLANGGKLAAVNDIIEIQDILPDSMLHTRLMNYVLLFKQFKHINDTRYFWLDRTQNQPKNNSISDRILKRCNGTNSTVINLDQHCIVVKFVTDNDGELVRCIAESSECEQMSAMPICIQTEEEETTVINNDDADTSKDDAALAGELRCDNDQYHYVGDYCYLIDLHEVSWADAVKHCENQQAQLFVPDKSVQMQLIKFLLTMKNTYSSNGFAHVGVFYDPQEQTVNQFSSKYGGPFVIPDSNSIYDMCDETFREKYGRVNQTTSTPLSNLANVAGCGYLEYDVSGTSVIKCDDLKCEREAAVICQKLPTMIAFNITSE